MTRSVTRSFLTTLALFILAASAFGQVPMREFVPVQDGYSPSGKEVAEYREGRVMVKFTRLAIDQLAIRHDQSNKAAVIMQTGLPSFDQVTAPFALQKIERNVNQQLKDQFQADQLGTYRWYKLDFGAGRDMEAIAAQLRNDPNVDDATPDYVAFPAAVPNDPLHPDHWGHNNTVQLNDLDWGGTYEHTLPGTVGTFGFDSNAHAAWDNSQGYGSAGVVIAIIDSGVNVGHPDLRQVAGWDYGDNDSNPEDNSASAGHGTACAGVAASIQNNGLGAAGIAGGASIMPLKVANSAGSMFFSSIINAIYHAADNGADIISMSLGAAISSDAATDAALAYANSAGVTSFAATGNENVSTISYPANNINVIAVGAASPCGDRKRSSSSSAETNPGVSTDPNGYTCDGERWWGSNYGSTSQTSRLAVTLIAPTILPTTDIQGSGGYSTGNYSGYFNGTSAATPYAAGVAALVISANPGWTPAQVRDQLTSTCQDITNVESGAGWDRYSGFGMIDAAAATGGGGGPVTPVAEFSGSPTSGFAPLSVNFADLSSNAPTSWSWTFGDGSSSTAQNPSHSYTTAGSYNVTLTATNSAGSDGETKNGYITVNDPGSLYATLPFADGFEAGSLGPNWTSQSSNGEGRILVTTSNTPHSGSYHLTMDDSLNGGLYAQNEAWLHLNLAGEAQVDLDFWWKDFADESHAQDGVYFSDNGGASFSKVVDLPGASYANNVWNNFQVDLDAAAAGAGLSLSSTFVVKFQQYDNYGIATDGVAWDDISVTAGAAGSPPVAAFSGTPTSGDFPLVVNFTDASTNGPTSWSWTFGDGGSSTSQNPQYTYTAAGSYNVTLTATNAFGSDPETKTGYITVTTPSGGGVWEAITYDDFEAGWGHYVDGGSDCDRVANATFAHQGTYSARIRDNTSTSVFTHSTGYNVTGYVDLEVDFWYRPESMENNEDFWVQYNSGSGWQTVASFAAGTHFTNGSFYHETVQIPAGTYAYTSNAQIRFRCDASGNSDWIYVDEVEFRGLTAGSSSGDDQAFTKSEIPAKFSVGQNFPNPFNPMTTIEFGLPKASRVSIVVFDVKGRRVTTLADRRYEAGMHSLNWDATRFASGVYYYRINAGDFIETKRMTLVK